MPFWHCGVFSFNAVNELKNILISRVVVFATHYYCNIFYTVYRECSGETFSCELCAAGFEAADALGVVLTLGVDQFVGVGPFGDLPRYKNYLFIVR